MKSLNLVVISLLIIVLIIGYFLLTSTKSKKSEKEIVLNLKDIQSLIPFKGSDSAKINIIEFADFQCPFCRKFFYQVEPQIIKDFVDSGKAKFYFVTVAFLGSDSFTLAEGAWCANEQGLYYQYKDYIFYNQGTENSGWGSPSNLKKLIANMQEINKTLFNKCLDSRIYNERINELNKFATSNAITGVPTFFIGNDEIGYVRINGFQPYSVFKEKIEAQLSKVSS